MPPLRTAFVNVMREGDLPGLAIAKVEMGRLAWSYVLGRRNAMDTSPSAVAIDAATVFEAGSMGKPLVALTVLKLIEEGKLSLETPADSVLPLAGLTDPRKGQITIRMLLSHSSGLAFAAPRLQSEPGTAYSYSTLGFRYLQQIAEKKLGETLEQYALRSWFQPLGMAKTSFVYSPRFEPNRARGRNWLLRGQEYMTNAAGTGAFDLITTASDYATFWEAIYAGRIVKAKTLKLMFTPQLPVPPDENEDPGRQSRKVFSGLGFLVQRVGSSWQGFQWGDNGGTTGLILANPAKREALVYFSNAEDGLHSSERLAQLSGMQDLSAARVGYGQVGTPIRTAWKRITTLLADDAPAGQAAFQKLREENPPVGTQLARNLGFFARFRGQTADSEPFFRVASEQPNAEASVIGAWAEALLANDQLDAAAAAQDRAIAGGENVESGLRLSTWLEKAKADLGEAMAMDRSAMVPVGVYGPVRIGRDAAGRVELSANGKVRKLNLLPSGGWLSSDLLYRLEFRDGKAVVTRAGGVPQTYPRQG